MSIPLLFSNSNKAKYTVCSIFIESSAVSGLHPVITALMDWVCSPISRASSRWLRLSFFNFLPIFFRDEYLCMCQDAVFSLAFLQRYAMQTNSFTSPIYFLTVLLPWRIIECIIGYTTPLKNRLIPLHRILFAITSFFTMRIFNRSISLRQSKS